MCEVQAHYIDQEGTEQGANIEENLATGTSHLKVVYWQQRRTAQVKDVPYTALQQKPGTWHWTFECQLQKR